MVENLLTETQALLNHVYWFEQDFLIPPRKDHLGAAINYSDIKERKDDFLQELITTVSSWVYSKEKSKAILDERLDAVNGDYGNAATFLTRQAFSKFRPGYPQGQFGELLLFNFIQHFFKAAPLLRKQRITTSYGHERFGADALHFKQENNCNVIILGESKCYKSNYQFRNAFETSLTSIIHTFDTIDKELNLYIYDDFIEPELEVIAKQYKAGTLTNVRFEMVCLVAYNEKSEVSGDTEHELKESIKKIIAERCSNLDPNKFSNIAERKLNRINYIIFPIWKLDELLSRFQTLVGSEYEA